MPTKRVGRLMPYAACCITDVNRALLLTGAPRTLTLLRHDSVVRAPIVAFRAELVHDLVRLQWTLHS